MAEGGELPENLDSREGGREQEAVSGSEESGHEAEGGAEGHEEGAEGGAEGIGTPKAAEVGKEPPASFASLSKELLWKIFSYLPQGARVHGASLVCKHWRVLIEDYSIWTSVKMISPRGKKNTRVLDLIGRWTHLKTVDLRFFSPVDSILLALAENCRALETLEMTDCTIEWNSTVVAVVRDCTALQKVHFDRCMLKEREQMSSVNIFSLCPRLQTLSMHNPWGYFDSSSVKKLLPGAYANLTEVRLTYRWCDAEFKALVNAAGTQLRVLCLDGLCEDDSYLILSHCHHLESLTLTCTGGVSESTLLNGLGRLRNLRRLTIFAEKNCFSNAYPEVNAILSQPHFVSKLTYLHLYGFVQYVSDSCWNTIAKHSKELKTLILGPIPAPGTRWTEMPYSCPYMQRGFRIAREFKSTLISVKSLRTAIPGLKVKMIYG